jgi:hypothetical protein
VLNVVREVRELDPRISVYYNPQTDGFDLVESCLDGTDRLIFSVEELDARVLHRLRGLDHWGGNETPERFVLSDDEDFAARVDADNEALKAEQQEQFRDQLGDAGERLAWAMDIAGPSVGGSIHVKRSVDDGNAERSEPGSGHATNGG